VSLTKTRRTERNGTESRPRGFQQPRCGAHVLVTRYVCLGLAFRSTRLYDAVLPLPRIVLPHSTLPLGIKFHFCPRRYALRTVPSLQSDSHTFCQFPVISPLALIADQHAGSWGQTWKTHEQPAAPREHHVPGAFSSSLPCLVVSYSCCVLLAGHHSPPPFLT
jgi:hypothetical protein